MSTMIPVIVGLIAGSFLYQYLGHQDWNVAIDHSFFEVAGALAYYVTLKGRKSLENRIQKS